MSANPMDGYQDIYPWPYSWTKDIAGPVISMLTPLNLVYDNLVYWNYEAHKKLSHPNILVPNQWIVDVYWSDERGDRLQMPPAIGDHVAELVVGVLQRRVELMLWNFRQWSPRYGWRPWTGPQGDFVDHLHLEFSKERYDYDQAYGDGAWDSQPDPRVF